MRDRSQAAAVQHSIKSRKSSSYAVAVPLQKTLHGSPPVVRLLLQTIMPDSESWSVPILVAA
jgi:hypothetical protein